MMQARNTARKASPGAWARLINWDGGDDYLEMCQEAANEIKTETGARLAGLLRAEALRWGGDPDRQHVLRGAADLIDPQAVAP
jgi:hypothetical protein